MKATELMINDWVYSDTLNQPHQINPSDFRFMNTRAQDVFGENGEFIHIHPIPLTPEILEANDFRLGYNDRYYAIFDDTECLFCIRIRRGGSLWIPVSVYGKGIILKHVHQLQHALRLAGFTDLADNFKLE